MKNGKKKNPTIKRLKNIPNQAFLKSPKLQKSFGLLGDADKDGVMNMNDCMPFDPNKDGFFSRIGEAIKSAAQTVVSAVRGGAAQSVISAATGTASASSGTASASTGTAAGSSSGTAGSSSGGGGVPGVPSSKGTEIRDAQGRLIGYDTGTQSRVATTQEIASDALGKAAGRSSGGGTYNAATGVYTSPQGNKQSVASAPVGAVVINSSGNKDTGQLAQATANLQQNQRLIQQAKEQANKQNISQKPSNAQNQPVQNQPQQSGINLRSEARRYAQIGYKPWEAIVLAQESVRRGGMTFSPQESERILKLNNVNRDNGNADVLPRVSGGMANRSVDNNTSNKSDFSKGSKAYEEKRQAVITTYQGAVTPIKLSIGEAINAVLGNVKTAWKNRGIKTVSAADILEPIEHTGELKSEQIVEQIIPTGTINQNNVTIKLTKEELARMYAQASNTTQYSSMTSEAAYYKLSEDIQNKLLPEYQEKLNTGNLTEQQANEQYKKAVAEEFNKQVGSVSEYFAERERLGIGERTGKDIAEKIPGALETAGIIALSATGPAGAVVASSYIAGKGSEKIQRAILDEDMTATQRIMTGAAGTIAAVGGAAGVAGTINRVEKEVQNEIILKNLENLNRQEIKFIGLNVQGEEGSIGVLKAVQGTSKLKTEYELAGIIKKVGNRAYFMPYGAGTASTSGTVLSTGEKDINIIAESVSSLGSKGIIIPVDETLSKILSKDVAEEILSTGALYEKGSVKVSNMIVFPTGTEIAKPNKAAQKLIDDLTANLKQGKEININFEETNIMRIDDDIFSKLSQKDQFILGGEKNINKIFYSETIDKQIKGITKVISPDDFVGKYENIINPSDDIYNTVLKQYQQEQLEKNLVSQLNSLKENTAASFENIIKQPPASNKIVKVSTAISNKIPSVKEETNIRQPDVTHLNKQYDMLNIGQETNTAQTIKLNQGQGSKNKQGQKNEEKQIANLGQQTKNVMKEIEKSNEQYVKAQQPRLNQKQVQQQTQQQIQRIINLNRMRTPTINDMANPGFNPPPIPIVIPKRRDGKMIPKRRLARRAANTEEGYTASLASAIFQSRPLELTKKDYERLKKTTFSGLEERPVIKLLNKKQRHKELDVSMDFSL